MCLYQCNNSMKLREKEKGKENDRATIILHIERC
jgi:hypothetical protein